MIQDEQPAAWRTVLGRSIVPAGFLLALLLLLLLPVAGVSCDPDTSGPVHLCYTGGEFVTGSPSVDMSLIYAGPAQQTAELRDAIVNTVEPSGAVRVLAVIAAIALTVGMLSVLVRPSLARAATVAIAAVAGVVLLVITEAVAVTGLADGADNALTLFSAGDVRSGRVHDGADVAGTAPGFWLALSVLVVLAVYSVGSLVRRRFAAIEQDLRTPGTDLPVRPD